MKKFVVNLGEVPPSKIEISNFMRFFPLKGTLIQLKTLVGVSSYDTKGPWKL